MRHIGSVLAWSSLLVQRIDLQMRAHVLRKLQVNRHRVAEVRRHTHPYDQAILFLSGEGHQIAGDRTLPAAPGDLFLIPAGRVHGYVPSGQGRPTCLVLDYDRARSSAGGRISHRRLAPGAMNDLHAFVSRLPRKGALGWEDYASVAAVVALLFETREATDAERPAPSGMPAYDKVRRMLLDPTNSELPLSTVAKRAGFQADYLTRKLRRESGQGLRELRDSLRFEVATAALRSGAPVAAAAEAAGFADPGYFSRWFRKRTRTTPSEFAAQSFGEVARQR